METPYYRSFNEWHYKKRNIKGTNCKQEWILQRSNLKYQWKELQTRVAVQAVQERMRWLQQRMNNLEKSISNKLDIDKPDKCRKILNDGRSTNRK